MAIKIKAQERKLMVGPKAGQYAYQLAAETYSTLTQSKMIEEAALRSGIQRGSLYASFDAIGSVIKAWATEGHSIPVPGVGTMRFGLRATSVSQVADVGTNLITSRRVVFTPNVDIKRELATTPINITCYDRNGDIIKQVTSGDGGVVEDPDNESGSGSGSGSGSSSDPL